MNDGESKNVGRPNDGEPTEAVEVPGDVLARVRRRLPGTEFGSESEYVTHVLETALVHVERVDDGTDHEGTETAVRDRLQSLGYLDE